MKVLPKIHVEESETRILMKKWFNFRTVSNLPKPNGMTKINRYRDRDLTAWILKYFFNLKASNTAIYRFLTALGLKKLFCLCIPFGFGKLEIVLKLNHFFIKILISDSSTWIFGSTFNVQYLAFLICNSYS